MSAGNIRDVTVAVEDDTPVKLYVETDARYAGRPCYDRIHIGGLTLWPGYLSDDDTVVVNACDRLIDALQQVRAHSLQRLAAATLAADPGLVFAGTVGDFLAAQEGEAV